MKRSTVALVGALAVGLIGGGTAYALTTTGQEPAAIETTASPNAEPSPEPTTADTPSVEPAPTDASTGEPYLSGPEADAAFLKYVADEKPDPTLLDAYTDAELIELGYDACKQADASVPWADIRLVEGEEPTDAGYYLDTSAILNGALYNYCPDLIPDVESGD